MPVSHYSTLVRAGLLLLLVSAGVHPAQADEPQKRVSNSLGMEFVLLPAGSFLMGSPPDEPYRDKSEARHQVNLTRPFYMQTTEVTFGQWRAVMGSWFMMRWKGPENLPVTEVSWHDTQDFLKKLNELGEGRYRLPTEAEWEYAARAGSTTAYSWGDRIDCSRAMYANSRFGSKTCLDKRPGLLPDSPAPVKSFSANQWGLYDMHGNAWEWVQDWFAPYPQKPLSDPQGPREGTHRVRRGGSWYGQGSYCRSANRAFAHPANREITSGFRVVRVVEPDA